MVAESLILQEQSNQPLRGSKSPLLHQTAMGGRAPEDVLGLIFDYLLPRDAAFKAGLCLTCRSWTGPATRLLYNTVEPLSLNSMNLLKATLRVNPTLTRHIKSLVFPHFSATQDRFWMMAHFNHSQAYFHSWYQCERNFKEREVALRLSSHQLIRLYATDLNQLVELFMDIALECHGLETLQMPFYYHNHIKTRYQPMLASLRNLILLHRPHLVQPIGKDIDELPFQMFSLLGNLQSLVLCDFRDIQHFESYFDSPELIQLQNLKTLFLESSPPIPFVMQLVQKVSQQLTSLVVSPGYFPDKAMWPWYGSGYKIFPHIEKFGKSLSSVVMRINKHSCPNFNQFEGLTSLTLAVEILTPELFNSLPETLETLTISDSTVMPSLYLNRPFNCAKILAGAREKLRLLPSLSRIHLQGNCTRGELSSWYILTYCLAEMYKIIGVSFSISIRLDLEVVIYETDNPFRWGLIRTRIANSKNHHWWDWPATERMSLSMRCRKKILSMFVK